MPLELPSWPSPLTAEAAFAKHLPALNALPEASLLQVNVDVDAMVDTTLRAIPEILRLHDQITALPGLDLEAYARLGEYALALMHAQALFRRSGEVVAARPDEAALRARRKLLLGEARLLVLKRRLAEGELVGLGRGRGPLVAAADLFLLATRLRAALPLISPFTTLTAAELEADLKLATEARTQLQTPRTRPGGKSEAALIRQRAFTATFRAWDTVRRALTYLRWAEGDAARIAPSYFPGPRKRSAGNRTATPPKPPDGAKRGPGRPAKARTPEELRAEELAEMERLIPLASVVQPNVPGGPGGDPFGRI